MFTHKNNTYLQIDTAKIYYEELGDKSKDVLLFLHGGLGTIEDLGEIAKDFINDYRIIGIDSRGHGASTLGKNKLSYELIENDIYAILDYLNIKKVSIIGFSDGGIVGLRMASSNKIKVEKLVSIASSWNLDEQQKDIYKSLTAEEMKNIFSKEYDLYQKLNSEANFELLSKELIKMWIDESSSGYPNENVKNISAKTLLIRGDNDFLTSLNSFEVLQSKLSECSILNIPFAEHEVYKEEKEIVVSYIKRFF